MIPLLAFTRFEVGRLFRSWKFLIVTVGFPVVFYMLFLGDHSPNKLIEGAVPWRSYLLVSMCSFGSLVAALTAGGARLSAERTSGWARQLRVTPIPDMVIRGHQGDGHDARGPARGRPRRRGRCGIRWRSSGCDDVV